MLLQQIKALSPQQYKSHNFDNSLFYVPTKDRRKKRCALFSLLAGFLRSSTLTESLAQAALTTTSQLQTLNKFVPGLNGFRHGDRVLSTKKIFWKRQLYTVQPDGLTQS